MQAPTHKPTRLAIERRYRRRRVWGLASAFVLILAAIGIAVLLRRDDVATLRG